MRAVRAIPIVLVALAAAVLVARWLRPAEPVPVRADVPAPPRSGDVPSPSRDVASAPPQPSAVEVVRYDFDTIASPAGSSEAAAWPLFDQLVKTPPPVSLPAEAERHERQTLDQVTQTFGPRFAEALTTATPGRFDLVDSHRGFLILRLRQKSDASAAPVAR